MIISQSKPPIASARTPKEIGKALDTCSREAFCSDKSAFPADSVTLSDTRSTDRAHDTVENIGYALSGVADAALGLGLIAAPGVGTFSCLAMGKALRNPSHKLLPGSFLTAAALNAVGTVSLATGVVSRLMTGDNTALYVGLGLLTAAPLAVAAGGLINELTSPRL